MLVPYLSQQSQAISHRPVVLHFLGISPLWCRRLFRTFRNLQEAFFIRTDAEMGAGLEHIVDIDSGCTRAVACQPALPKVCHGSAMGSPWIYSTGSWAAHGSPMGLPWVFSGGPHGLLPGTPRDSTGHPMKILIKCPGKAPISTHIHRA